MLDQRRSTLYKCNTKHFSFWDYSFSEISGNYQPTQNNTLYFVITAKTYTVDLVFFAYLHFSELVF